MRISRNSISSVMRNRSLCDARTRANISSNKQSLGKTAKYRISDLYQATSGDRAAMEAKIHISNKENEAQVKKNYADLKESANNMLDAAKNLLNTDEDSLFAEALAKPGEGEEAIEEAKKKKEKLVEEIADFLDEYNNVVSKMRSIGGKVNEIYGEQINKLAVKNKEALKEIGVTINGNGTLSVDKKMLGQADVEKLQKLFGTQGGFADKSAQMGKTVGQNAQNNINSIKSYSFSPNYNRYGSSYDDYGSGTGYHSMG